jgi:hypothetical protein
MVDVGLTAGLGTGCVDRLELCLISGVI